MYGARLTVRFRPWIQSADTTSWLNRKSVHALGDSPRLFRFGDLICSAGRPGSARSSRWMHDYDVGIEKPSHLILSHNDDNVCKPTDENLTFVFGNPWRAIAAASALAFLQLTGAQAQPIVAEVYLLGPMPRQVPLLEQLPPHRSEVTVTTGRNSAGRPLSYKVMTSGGIAAGELPAILKASELQRILKRLLIEYKHWIPKESWQIQIHGDDRLVRVTFHFPTLARSCDQQWLVAHTPSGWMRLDPSFPLVPNCVFVTEPTIPSEYGVEYLLQ